MDDDFTEPLIYSDSDDEHIGGMSKVEQSKGTELDIPKVSNDGNGDRTVFDNLPSTDSILLNDTHLPGAPNDDSGDDSDDFNVRSGVKRTRLISDDSGKEDNDEPRLNLHYSESENEENGKTETKTVNERPKIWDSDSRSSEKEMDSDVGTQKPSKQVKKKKFVKRKEIERKHKKAAASSENSSSDDEEEAKATISKLKALCSDESSDSTNSDGNGNEATDEQSIQPREKPEQRKSAKVAVDQMKEIQSESQRMAREIYFNVPYHKPKQYSLKEFMNRRSIASAPKGFSGLQKAAAAIKMSDSELAQYARSLEERAEEAIQFFRNENEELKKSGKFAESNSDAPVVTEEQTAQTIDDGSENFDKPAQTPANDSNGLDSENPSTAVDKSTANDETVESPNLMQEDAAAPVTPDVFETLDVAPHDESDLFDISLPGTSKTPLLKKPEFTRFHTERTDLDLELDEIDSVPKQKKEATLGGDAPRLSGWEGMVIDLETNEVKAKQKTGAEVLFERFLKTAGKCHVKADRAEISIFNKEKGILEIQKLNVEPVGAQDKEAKPGEAFLKLKDELSKKITEKRKEVIAKRLQEEAENNIDDESEAEYSDSGEDSDAEMELKKNQAFLIDEAAEEKEDATNADGPLSEDEDENEESLVMYEDDVNSNDGEDDGQDIHQDDGDSSDGEEKPKNSRILRAFEDDSDQEFNDEERPKDKCADKPLCSTQSQNVSSENLFSQDILSSRTDTESNQNVHDISSVAFLESVFDLKKPSNEPTPAANLYSQDMDGETIGDSQLEALCSGSFATQAPNADIEEHSQAEPISQLAPVLMDKTTVDDVDEATDSQIAFLSSDEEEGDKASAQNKQKTKKKKVRKLEESSDDESEAIDENKENERCASLDGDDEEEDVERYVEYDSDENEIEVKLGKKGVKQKASEYFQNEAELSESDWGSSDEDEKDLNEFDQELGDEDEFDKDQLKHDLERIRLRQQIDEDAREVRIIKEMLFEEEEERGDRERKFRWKHLDNQTNLTDMARCPDDEVATQESDDENEIEWRRLRYEREQLLKQQLEQTGAQDEQTNSAGHENQSNATVTTTTSVFRRTSIIKSAKTITSPQKVLSFVPNQIDSVQQKGRKSFLGRDEKTLEKLVNLTKGSGDGETVATTANTKGHYLFTTTDKANVLKRRSENVSADETPNNNNTKKPRLSKGADEKKAKSQQKCIFELLN